jgi:hypothetical protein
MRSGPDSKLNVREPAVKRRELEDEVVVTIRQVLLSFRIRNRTSVCDITHLTGGKSNRRLVMYRSGFPTRGTNCIGSAVVAGATRMQPLRQQRYRA